MQLNVDPDQVKGFLDPLEGERLYDLAQSAAQFGPCLEIGSYCGKSTLYIGAGVKASGGVLFALDHHRGSEEHQMGELYHDPELYDDTLGKMDSLPAFRRTLANAELEGHVIALITASVLAGRYWQTPLSMVFIDGGHSMAAALNDYRIWSRHIKPGGYLAIHDIFPDPKDGGQAPYSIYQLAQASGQFETLPSTQTLGVLRRL